MGKAFEKQIKTIEDQGKKQVDALENLKPKEQTKPIENKSNNQSKAATIFNDLISKRKKIMSELYDSIDYNNLNFEYVGPTKDVSFYEYMDSKELFNKLKGNRIRFSHEQETSVKNLENFYKSSEEVLNFFRDYTEMFFNAS